MAATATQRAAIDALEESGARRTQRQIIMDLFAGNPAIVLTREDIAARTNMRLSSVCGRVRESLDGEWLTVRGERRCVATGQMHELIGLPSPY